MGRTPKFPFFIRKSSIALAFGQLSFFFLVNDFSPARAEEPPVLEQSATETGTEKNPLKSKGEIDPEDADKSETPKINELPDTPLGASSPEASPQPPAAIAEPIPIEFFRPELGYTNNEKRTRVMVSGKTIPGASIIVANKKLPYFTANQKLNYLNLEDVLVGKRMALANAEGLFVFNFDLPPENIQITLKITKPKSEVSQSFQLNLAVTKQEVKVSDLGELKESPLYSKHYALWLGTGFNFLRYAQESSDIQSNIEFQTFKGPSFFARGWWKVKEELDASFEAKMSPGGVDSSSDIEISSGNYNWTIFAIEGTYYPHNWKTTFQEHPSRWGVRAGFQHHIVPFISRTGASETSAEIVTNSLSMFTIGFQNNVDISSKWAFEWLMRYQSPLFMGSVFQILPNFGFDGSVGLIRALQRNWKLGFYWYGQWHDYSFVHEDRYLINQGDPTPTIKGHQVLFFSNIEVRAGFEFN
ncbi:MAG: hypothetical protein IPK68_13635 [Bdellovibrionales bacterium]|nr:hypothetical protein [Bdellovibrionales bacterium]